MSRFVEMDGKVHRTGWDFFWHLMGRTAIGMGLILLIPLLAALWWQENAYGLYALPSGISLLVGTAILSQGFQTAGQMSVREGALFMIFVWPFMSLLGLMPYYFSGLVPDLMVAFFESVSSLTTTGLSCLQFDEVHLPKSLLLWHSLMSWFGGGMFVIILVSVLPQVSGCFGLTLSAKQSAVFSPVWRRMSQSAREGTGVYLALTLLAAVLFLLAGSAPAEALMRAMLTLSSGGGSSVYQFIVHDKPALELAAGVAMLLSAINLVLCARAWKRRSLRLFLQDTELRVFLLILLSAGALVSIHLFHVTGYGLADSLRYGFFQVISFLSTNGYASASFWLWPDFDRYVLFLLVFIGGCIGSTGGGLKIVRILVLMRLTRIEIHRTLHPHLVSVVKLDGLPVSAKIASRLLTFFFLYAGIFALFSILLSLTGISLPQAMGLTAGCLTSTGSTTLLFGIGNLYFLPDWAKLLCSLLMIIGRMEIFSFLILMDLGIRSVQKKW